jgi:hypothetical protein
MDLVVEVDEVAGVMPGKRQMYLGGKKTVARLIDWANLF